MSRAGSPQAAAESVPYLSHVTVPASSLGIFLPMPQDQTSQGLFSALSPI